MTFEELSFKPHNIGNGKQARTFFDNGFGVSVVQFDGSYVSEAGLYELAVLKGDKDDWELTYDTAITDDVIGHLSPQEVTTNLKLIAEL